jgi:hypothetical protein
VRRAARFLIATSVAVALVVATVVFAAQHLSGGWSFVGPDPHGDMAVNADADPAPGFANC